MTRFIKTRSEIKKPKKMAAKKKSSQKENHVVHTNEKVCSYYNCNKKAVGAYTVDLDVKGLGFCEKHKSDISSAFLWAIIGVEELSYHAMGIPSPKKKKK
jgi:hypothetical protein